MGSRRITAMWNRLRAATSRRYRRFNPAKKKLIDAAFGGREPAGTGSGNLRVADLGGVWGVDGAYTFYTLDRYHPEAAFLVDMHFTDPIRERLGRYPALTLVEGDFRDPDTITQLGELDRIFLFDVLLHQVAPDWDEILRRYARVTKDILVFNQQYADREHTVRLMDLGEEAYFRNVPHDREHPSYQGLFEHLDEPHPRLGGLWRDSPAVWQWGITDGDLKGVMSGLGYELVYYRNWGPYGRMTNVEDHAFLFRKT